MKPRVVFGGHWEIETCTAGFLDCARDDNRKASGGACRGLSTAMGMTDVKLLRLRLLLLLLLLLLLQLLHALQLL